MEYVAKVYSFFIIGSLWCIILMVGFWTLRRLD
jgi:hypothetical protein